MLHRWYKCEHKTSSLLLRASSSRKGDVYTLLAPWPRVLSVRTECQTTYSDIRTGKTTFYYGGNF